MKSKFAVLLVALFVLIPMARSAVNGVTVESTRYDAAKDELIVTVANVSHKDVTAFALDVHLPDGELIEEFTRELLSGPDNLGFFHPGTTTEVHLAGRKGATVTPSAVIYDDATAEASNLRALKHITQSRQEMALALRKANELLAANPNDPEAAAKELEREGSIHVRNTNDPVPSEGMMLQLATEIRRSTDLGAFVENNEKQAKHYTDHAHPVVEGVKP